MKWIVLIEGGSLKSPGPQTLEVEANSLPGAVCATEVPWGTVTAIVRKDVWDQLQEKEKA